MPSSATPFSVPSRLGNRMHSPKKTVYRSATTPLPWVLATAPRPTHKAGDPGIGKDSGKVSGAFSCRSLFWE